MPESVRSELSDDIADALTEDLNGIERRYEIDQVTIDEGVLALSGHVVVQ
jgi:hypothetical protein